MTRQAQPAEGPVLTLAPNTPIPFQGSTTIAFSLPEGAGRAMLQILDIQGRAVRTLMDAAEAPGEHLVTWDGTNSSGRHVAPGVYLYRLQTAHGGQHEAAPETVRTGSPVSLRSPEQGS